MMCSAGSRVESLLHESQMEIIEPSNPLDGVIGYKMVDDYESATAIIACMCFADD